MVVATSMRVRCRDPVQLRSVCEDQVAEPKDAPIVAHILPQTVVKLLSNLLCVRMLRMRQQPLLPSASPAGLKGVPLTLIRGADTKDPPPRTAGSRNQLRERKHVTPEDGKSFSCRHALPATIAKEQTAARVDHGAEGLQSRRSTTPCMRSPNANDAIGRRDPFRRWTLHERHTLFEPAARDQGGRTLKQRTIGIHPDSPALSVRAPKNPGEELSPPTAQIKNRLGCMDRQVRNQPVSVFLRQRRVPAHGRIARPIQPSSRLHELILAQRTDCRVARCQGCGHC